VTTQLILLGTAAGPTPKVDRNAPAQAIVVDGRCYLIDCGNGVARQLLHAGVPLSTLRAVFITHHHSDHNADFGTLFLVGWSQINSAVHLFGPPPIARMTQDFFRLHAQDIEVRTQDEGRPALRNLVRESEVKAAGTVFQDDFVRVSAALVNHPPLEWAFAFRFDTPDRSIVISGDTTPWPGLVALARGADVLVHEAMYTEELAAHLGSTNATTLLHHLVASHSSAEDAGAIAAAAGVKTLVLSHLFPPDQSVDDSTWKACARKSFDGEIIVGRDLLVV
jgi:ribonuclease BN (tRNA processing enzyme)